ncbi:MAG: hypothetical protein ACRDK4_11440 [Solirubrobacteraceae bacterium]
MIGMRLNKSTSLGVVLAGLFAIGVGAGAAPSRAESLSPWWGVTIGARPSNLQPEKAKDEVQEVTVNATGGEFILSEPIATERGEFENAKGEPQFVILGDSASAGEVRSGLEGFYGAGNVEVTGGAQGSESKYVVTFTGALAYKQLKPIGTRYSEEFGFTAPGQLSVSEQSAGASAGVIVVTAENLGDANIDGAHSPVSITDELPPGLKAVAIEGVSGLNRDDNDGPVGCSLESARTVSCKFEGTLPPFETIEARVSVIGQPGLRPGEEDEAGVSGGGAANASIVRRPVRVGGETQFGVEEYGLVAEEAGGGRDRQAGSHPFQLTTTLNLNQTGEEATPAGAMTKDLRFDLPPGLVGNPTPLPQCTDAQFARKVPNTSNVNECPSRTAVGVAVITINEPDFIHLGTVRVPIFNLVPRAGEPARFGFLVQFTPVFLDTSVRTGGDYGVTVSVNNITQVAGFLGNKVTFWGVPGDPRHDNQRGWGCINNVAQEAGLPCKPLEALNPPPFLSLPTSCTGPLQTSVQADSWQQPGVFVGPVDPNEPMAGLNACNHLPFEPTVSVKPDVPAGSTPTGLTVGVHVPQDAALNATGIAESTLRDTTVTLPAGVTLNPGGADGLEACSNSQVGFLPGDSHGEELRFTPDQPSCPDGSKVGTVKIKTPLLPNALEGEVYLAEQNANPFGSLIAMYIVATDPVSGVLVKLPGEVVPDPVSGQLVSTFTNTPQLPFEDLELHFFGGDRAPLSTPPSCGSYETKGLFAPWSGEPAVDTSSKFDITSGPNGSPCASPLPFSPSLTTGSTNIQAGAFTPFTMTMSREDGQQNLQAIQLRMPPGLLGTLASVALCPEPQASQGTCGANSLIGETTVSVGLGGNPYAVKGGRVYITGPYEGAPYGLSIVNPAKAGPFDLGEGPCDCVLVRAKIEVNPITAALTITSDNTGPYKIPQILQGIPLQIKHVNVTINRPNFTFNPTNCSPMAITGNLSSTGGASQALSVPFQITNCAVLAFKPHLTAKTNGKTSRAKGASLSVKLAYPAGPYDANIAKVKVDLPKQLPSRLTTLQQACPARIFEANPANCPGASIVGHATATTPVMPVALTGPAYFVSHGGEAFPDLIIVLQGYGATVHLVGSTFISKAGITSSTFKTIPDVPVGTFELTLPQGKFSALAANGNLCTTKKLTMPTLFIAQNGATIKTTTPIVPTGCAKHAKAKHKHKAKSKK